MCDERIVNWCSQCGVEGHSDEDLHPAKARAYVALLFMTMLEAREDGVDFFAALDAASEQYDETVAKSNDT